MAEYMESIAIAQTIALMTSYSFDTQGNTPKELVKKWLEVYQESWIRLATIEALYLGRYKSVSIEQIMGVWLRLGEPKPHFNGEFERMICRKLPRYLTVSDSDLDPRDLQEQILEQPQLPKTQNNTTLVESTSPDSDSLDNPDKEDTEYLPDEKNNRSIHRFTPLPDMSSFFKKLRALGIYKRKIDRSKNKD